MPGKVHDGVKYCYNKSLFVNLHQILIFLPLKSCLFLSILGIVLKRVVVVKWPEDMLGCLVTGEVCSVIE